MMDYGDEYWFIGVVDCKWGLYKEFWWQIIYGGYSLKFCQVNIIIFFFYWQIGRFRGGLQFGFFFVIKF